MNIGIITVDVQRYETQDTKAIKKFESQFRKLFTGQKCFLFDIENYLNN